MSSSDRSIGLSDFEGRGAAVDGLINALKTGAPMHAALIAGPSGVGKRTLAALLAQSLHCAGDDKPCGICPGCVRFLANSHPDAHRIFAIKKSIGVNDIRSLIKTLSMVAYEGGIKTVRIEHAETMTLGAQNAFLKTLEEPSGNTVFLLTTASLTALLPTVRSRCKIVLMPPMQAEAVLAALVRFGVPKGIAAPAAALSGGSVGDALKKTEDSAFWQLRSRAVQAMAALRSPADVWNATDALKDDRSAAAEILELFEGSLGNALHIRTTGRGAPSNEWEEKLAGTEARFLIKRLHDVKTARRMLSSNVSWQAVLERFILDYVEDLWQL